MSDFQLKDGPNETGRTKQVVTPTQKARPVMDRPPTAYEAGQVLFNTLRAYLGISGVDASTVRLVLEFDSKADRDKVISDLQKSCTGPDRSAAKAGNDSGFWQGVPYTYRTRKADHD